ncbi:LysR family transcriptional regulator [Actinomadura madurae]|uniref:LysR family transcriptional regulator n=1 Tax=Actinomadura madurae TaxID=1993 RepID=UPI0009453364|nr:LysR family transcriptional regulator [Actinomadura madurae]
MEIRHLRYFLAVADELHFGRAARALHMSQPPLSARIKDLEREIGTPLFTRSPRGVALTPAGRALLPSARKAVEAFGEAQRVARKLRARPAAPLRVAITPDTTAAAVRGFTTAVRRANLARVEIVEASTGEQLDALDQGKLDIGLLRHPFPESGLHVEPPLRTPAGAFMGRDHPLARRDALRAADLADYPIVLFPRPMAPGLHDETLAALAAHGLRPSTEMPVTRLLSALLTTENSIAIRQPGMDLSGDLVWLPIDDLQLAWRTSVVWPLPATSLSLPTYAAALSEALLSHDQWRPEAGPSDPAHPLTP